MQPPASCVPAGGCAVLVSARHAASPWLTSQPAACPPLPLQSTCNIANCKQCTRTGKCKECNSRYLLNSFTNTCMRWLG